MAPTSPAQTGRPSRQGLIELLLVVGFLAVAATGSVVLFGDELRQAFGGRPASPAASRAP